MTDRQLKAVAEAMMKEMEHGITLQMAQAAIDASDARYVPALVEALKQIYGHIQNSINDDAGVLCDIIGQAIAALPEDLR